jgi:hypothetical protein
MYNGLDGKQWKSKSNTGIQRKIVQVPIWNLKKEPTHNTRYQQLRNLDYIWKATHLISIRARGK